MTSKTVPRCAGVTKSSKQCPRKTAGAGTRFCVKHHRLHFGETPRRMQSGAIAGRPGYLGSHGHLNR